MEGDITPGFADRHRRREREEANRPFPSVKGRCPACGSATLFLGAGGYVTCSWIECSNPSRASEVLKGV